MLTDVELLRRIERAPLRTARYADLAELGNNVWRALDRLAEQGAVVRIAKGVYTAPPAGEDGRTWKPTIEAAGLAVATARFGERNAILMGLGAARHWTAIPRAIAVTTVAVPELRQPVRLDAGGTVHMIPRDLDRVEAQLEDTELGEGLVTTPRQTMYDLLMRPNQGKLPDAARDAARNFRGQVTGDDLAEICESYGRANDAVRDMVRDLRNGHFVA